MSSAVTLIEDNSLKAIPGGFEVKVRLNWYRSLPLSCIENIRLLVNGEEIASVALRFQVNGQSYLVKDLAAVTSEYWFVQDSGVLQAQMPGKVAEGGSYTVEAEITLRAPYILVGPGKFLTMPTRYATTLIAG